MGSSNTMSFGQMTPDQTTADMSKQNSMNMSASIASISSQGKIGQRKFDVLKVYEDLDYVNNQSILTGGLDTGIEIGKFIIDTSNNLTPG